MLLVIELGVGCACYVRRLSFALVTLMHLSSFRYKFGMLISRLKGGHKGWYVNMYFNITGAPRKVCVLELIQKIG